MNITRSILVLALVALAACAPQFTFSPRLAANIEACVQKLGLSKTECTEHAIAMLEASAARAEKQRGTESAKLPTPVTSATPAPAQPSAPIGPQTLQLGPKPTTSDVMGRRAQQVILHWNDPANGMAESGCAAGWDVVLRNEIPNVAIAVDLRQDRGISTCGDGALTSVLLDDGSWLPVIMPPDGIDHKGYYQVSQTITGRHYIPIRHVAIRYDPTGVIRGRIIKSEQISRVFPREGNDVIAFTRDGHG